MPKPVGRRAVDPRVAALLIVLALAAVALLYAKFGGRSSYAPDRITGAKAEYARKLQAQMEKDGPPLPGPPKGWKPPTAPR